MNTQAILKIALVMLLAACQQQGPEGNFRQQGAIDNEAAANDAVVVRPEPVEQQGPVNDDVADAPAPRPPAIDYPFELPQIPPGDRVNDDFLPFFNESILIQTDLAVIRNEDPNQLPFIRYLTLSNMDYFEFQPNLLRPPLGC